ncbi:MAG: cytochrome P450 [Acidimicrobiales bacterium]|nr:cytochrome P450 [Acidimicrobiia bacterium]NNF54562.1 cytochrome P450 [Acidimicrobiales bacterium]NNL28712.1 cytochrome P450 [Acidimicrobiia bacterium]
MVCVITTYPECLAVMRDPVTFTVDDPRFSTGRIVGESMLSTDGARHRAHREPWARFLTSGATRSHAEKTVSRVCDDLVSDLRQSGSSSADLRTALTGPLAVAVMIELLGLAVEPATLLAWYRDIVTGVDAVSAGELPPAVATEAMRELERAVTAAALPIPQQSPAALASNAAVVLFGGIETVDGSIANLFWHLLGDSTTYRRCLADPQLVPSAIEESFRLEPAASRVDRYATVTTCVNGIEIAKGALVIVALRQANRDPTVFPDPDRFDIDRPERGRHLTFARGPHACIGPHLARLEAITAFTAVAEELGELTLVQSEGPEGKIFRKPAELVVSWGR